MHELSICQALIGEVEVVATAKDARLVTDIYVNVGPLSGVERPLMQSAFPVAAAGTVAANATLHLEETPIRVRCNACGAETAATINRLVCGQCGDWRTQLQSGDELTLQRVAMQTNLVGDEAYV
jgi:hydrogenase nickel incorporation protein HypA/HybF